MVDAAINIIRNVNIENINFQWYRSTLKANNGLKDTLDYGHAVLTSADQLDEYIYTYGLMIESQWTHAVSILGQIPQPDLLIDYGCGQGLAGVLLHDLAQNGIPDDVASIVLIEPSAMALARAEALYRRLAPAAQIAAICKRFDDVEADDILSAGKSGSTLHIFSNSLDIPAFDALRLLERTLQPGLNTIISVSHDRAFNGGTPRIEAVKTALEHPSMASDLTVLRSDFKQFICSNAGQSKGVAWICGVEVTDG